VIGILVVIGVAAVIAVAGGSDGGGAPATAHETANVTVDGKQLPVYTASGRDAAVGATIPTLHGMSFDGSPVIIAPNGKPQAIVFLWHACPHCQAEVPRLVTLAKQGKLDGVDVTAVTTQTSPDYPNYPPSAWLEREQWPYPVMADSQTETAARAYGISAFPYFVFVDAQGRVVGRATGEIAPDSLTKIFQELRQGGPTSGSPNGPSTKANQ
jgi:thiol-disulfide isomerase/thioredoxin